MHEAILILWNQKFQDSKDMLHSSSEDKDDDTPSHTPSGFPDPDGGGLVFGSPTSNTDLHSLHPPPVHIFKLWQHFLDNINPLVKIFHTPTIQPLILEASLNLENISKGMETFLFAIYYSAVSSMTNAECESMAGEPRSTLLARYHAGTKTALINAGFLKTSDITVLRAYTLFLVSCDPPIISNQYP